MRLNKTERESLRKRVKILIPQMKKSEIVNHFLIEGYPAEKRLKCKKTTIKTRVSSKNVFLTFVSFKEVSQKETSLTNMMLRLAIPSRGWPKPGFHALSSEAVDSEN